MSDAADDAAVSLMLADFVNADGSNKLNIIGGGITVIGFDENLKTTMPHAVVARITFPPKYVGESPAVELALEHDDGSPVALPNPIGGSQLLRVGAAHPLKPAVMQNASVPQDAVWPSVQFAMHFASGLPLEPNRGYTWRVKIDHHTREDWTDSFYVFTPSPAPVIG